MFVMRTVIGRRTSRAEANRAMLVRQAKEDKAAADAAAAAKAAASAPAPIAEAFPAVEVAATRTTRRTAAQK